MKSFETSQLLLSELNWILAVPLLSALTMRDMVAYSLASSPTPVNVALVARGIADELDVDMTLSIGGKKLMRILLKIKL